MKKITTLMFVFLLSLAGSYAQTSCDDWNEYVAYKNTGPTGFFTLAGGAEEKAAQTYHYSGPGNITQVRVDGRIPNGIGSSFSAIIKVSIYNVDANNRPTTLVHPLATKTINWFFWETSRMAYFGGGGIPVSNDFALVVELVPYFYGQQFQVKYTGAGEGNGDDLPSKAGTSTGGNWASLLPTDDGDLYIVPKMKHYIEADFTASSYCNVNVGQTVNFSNMSLVSTDSMFNTIMLSSYTGAQTLYNWNFGDGSATSSLQNPSHAYSTAGVYTVSLTTTIDGWPMGTTFCSDTKTMDISVGLNVVGTPTNLSCYGNFSGLISLSASGGDNSNYQYSLNGIVWQSSSIFSGLAAGTYLIYVKDGLGCIKMGTPVTITQPTAISITSPVGITTATCGNSDGAILATATGGTGTLQYSLNNVNYQSNGSFTGLSAGNYVVYVKDANGCIVSKSVTVKNTSSPNLFILSYTNVSCNGGSDGTVLMVGSGGTGILQYSLDGVNFQTNGFFIGVGAGSYSPSVKDAAGCIGSLACVNGCNITITEPTAITFSLSQTPALCNGANDGQIDVLSVIGGTGTKTYSIDGVNFQSGTNFSGLTAGTYTVTVKDAASCIVTNTITVTEPNPIIVSLVASSNSSCYQSSDGTITVSATGGDGDYSYSLNGINFYPTGDFNGLEVGTYTVTVMDNNGCTGSISTTINEPSAITCSITTGNSTCGNANGTLLGVASGGSGSGFTYSIDGGVTSNSTGSFSGLANNTYLLLVTDGSGCQEVFTTIVSDSDGPVITGNTSTNVTCNGGSDGTITITTVTGGTGTLEYSVDGGQFQPSNMLTGLGAGQHIAVVKDANGCTGSITVTLSQPPAFTIVLSSTIITCYGGNDGTITVSAAGGSGTLAYSIDGINFQSTTTFSNLSAGMYYVTVRDGGGCTGIASIEVIEPKNIILVSAGVLHVSCFGNADGAINAIATGGTGALEYSIDGINYQLSGTFNNITSGTYTIYVRDAIGCIKTSVREVTQPDLLTINAIISDVSCASGDDGVIDITVTGGTTIYNYSWSNLSESEDIFNLTAGNYTLDVTDENGCTASDTFTVTEPSNPIIINGTVTDASGVNVGDGIVDITTTGGTPPYTYNWSNGETTEDLSFLLPSVYVITVTDANDCSFTTSFTVSFSVGIDELDENEINLYPNPASDFIYIELATDKIIDGIVLINVIGETVYKAASNDNKFEVDVRLLPNGIYFMNIQKGNTIITKKIVINK